MSLPSDAPSRVLDALSGGQGPALGATFLPEDALMAMRWGGRTAPLLVATACERMLLDFVFVPAWEPWADEAADRIASCGTAVLWVVPGPFGLLAEKDGWTATIKRSASEPEALRRSLEAQLDAIVEQVRRGARLGVTAIVVAEDLAGDDGLLVSPDFAIGEIMPQLGLIAGTAAEEALLSVWHSDGDIRALLSSARKHGFVGVHPGGLSVEAFEKLHRRARQLDMAVIGGLGGEALRSGGPAAVRSGTNAGLLSSAGGLLVSDDGSISTSEEVAALMLAISAARGQIAPEDAR